jgi:hypothetical protein
LFYHRRLRIHFVVEKLRGMVTQKIGRYGYGADTKVSSHMFRHDDKWFKISVKVEELGIDKLQVNQEIE